MTKPFSDEELAVRAHDVTTCLEGGSTSEFSTLPLAGHAVTLALHLRDCPPVPFKQVKDVCVHALHFHPMEVEPVLELLEEARMVDLVRSGKQVTLITPDVPVFSNLYADLGAVARPKGLTEHEQLTVQIMQQLSAAPVKAETLYGLGAEKKIVKKVLDIGAAGTLKLKKILGLLKKWQGWPLSTILNEGNSGALSWTQTTSPQSRRWPAAGSLRRLPSTTHHGINHFIFGPRRGLAAFRSTNATSTRMPWRWSRPCGRGNFSSTSTRSRGPPVSWRSSVTADTSGQTRRPHSSTRKWSRVASVIAAVNMAISLVTGSDIEASADEDVTLAFQKGQEYVESLVGRKIIARAKTIKAPEDVQESIDDFLLLGGKKA
ncbi:MAG: hypothetical protein IPO67_31840 [Deltaproteobacteria bacterium]|nr:hypothetical protein [Deltaproteobacteria bacterium]